MSDRATGALKHPMTASSVSAAAMSDRSFDVVALLDLLPHRGCMLMLRRLTVHGDSTFTGEACWQDDHPFVQALGNHTVPATLLVEAAAQTTGAGLVATDQANHSPHGRELGLLAGVRRCTFIHPVKTGRPVFLRATSRFMSPSLVHAMVEAEQNGAVVASLQVMLAVPRPQA